MVIFTLAARYISLALHRGGTEYHSTNESPGPRSFRLLELSRLLFRSSSDTVVLCVRICEVGSALVVTCSVVQ